MPAEAQGEPELEVASFAIDAAAVLSGDLPESGYSSAFGSDDPAGALRAGVADPRPQAADFQYSSGGWTKSADGSWVQAADLQQSSGGWTKSADGSWTQVVPGAEEGMQAKALNAHYAGEGERSAWRSQKNPDGTELVTHYASEAERGEYGTSVSTEGLFLDAEGAALDGTYGWVMDPDDGCFYVFDANMAQAVMVPGGAGPEMSIKQAQAMLRSGAIRQVACNHHSTPLAGQPVAGAGMVTLSAGCITMINDMSGHYRPEAEFLHQSLTELEDQGVDLSQARVTLVGGESTGRPGKQWLADQSEFGSDEISLRWEQFQQTQGNEPQIRRKEAALGELSRDPRFARAGYVAERSATEEAWGQAADEFGDGGYVAQEGEEEEYEDDSDG